MSTKYKNKLYELVHKNAAEVELLDQGRYFFRIKEGLDPVPTWIANLAQEFDRDAVKVFQEAIQYRFSMHYQYNKDTYAEVI